MLTSFLTKVGDLAVIPKVGDIAAESWEPFMVDGVPTGRFHVLEVTERPGGPVTSGIWEHKVEDSPEGTFFLKQVVEEVIYVIQGEAELTYPDGTVLNIAPGNTFYFPRGSEVTWRTSKDFVKFFVLY